MLLLIHAFVNSFMLTLRADLLVRTKLDSFRKMDYKGAACRECSSAIRRALLPSWPSGWLEPAFDITWLPLRPGFLPEFLVDDQIHGAGRQHL